MAFQEPMQLDQSFNEDNDSNDEAEIGTTNHREAIAIVSPTVNGSSKTLGFNVENPTLDLETIANSHSGLNKIQRLLFIADHCQSLRIEALKLALNYVKDHTYNIKQYQDIFMKLSETLTSQGQDPSTVIGQLDTFFIDQRYKRAQAKLEKLDADLKNYKSNSIKESIRRGHDDLGDHYMDMGNLTDALKCYSRSRDYCTSGKHVLGMCLNVIRVSIHLQNWAHVFTYVAKAEATPEYAQSGPTITKMACAAGLADLSNSRYKRAAKHFLSANFDHFDQGYLNPSLPASRNDASSSFSGQSVSNTAGDFLSPNNVAVYGGLTALATFDREELYKNIISSASFKLFLELEPQLRDAITKFYHSAYASSLSVLRDIKDNLLLDMYLQPHVEKLYIQIRQKALIQYFSPYSSADMHKMALSFNSTVNELEDELTQLILDGQVQVRQSLYS
jgi:COP9 signalosome complex subunit 1